MSSTSNVNFSKETGNNFNDVSLESLGMHILSGEVNDEAIKEAITFVLKSNAINSKDINILVNSSGGSVYDGFALVDIMQMSKTPIATIGVGSIMSMGVLILSAGANGKRIITRNATVMVHQFSHSPSGKFHELEASQKSMVYMKEQFIEHFRRHSTMSDKQINDIMFGPTDRYLTPLECKRYGLVDDVIDQLPDFQRKNRSLKNKS